MLEFLRSHTLCLARSAAEIQSVHSPLAIPSFVFEAILDPRPFFWHLKTTCFASAFACTAVHARLKAKCIYILASNFCSPGFGSNESAQAPTSPEGASLALMEKHPLSLDLRSCKLCHRQAYLAKGQCANVFCVPRLTCKFFCCFFMLGSLFVFFGGGGGGKALVVWWREASFLWGLKEFSVCCCRLFL